MGLKNAYTVTPKPTYVYTTSTPGTQVLHFLVCLFFRAFEIQSFLWHLSESIQMIWKGFTDQESNNFVLVSLLSSLPPFLVLNSGLYIYKKWMAAHSSIFA